MLFFFNPQVIESIAVQTTHGSNTGLTAGPVLVEMLHLG